MLCPSVRLKPVALLPEQAAGKIVKWFSLAGGEPTKARHIGTLVSMWNYL
jgi:hypothetical protein